MTDPLMKTHCSRKTGPSALTSNARVHVNHTYTYTHARAHVSHTLVNFVHHAENTFPVEIVQSESSHVNEICELYINVCQCRRHESVLLLDDDVGEQLGAPDRILSMHSWRRTV